MSRGLYRDAMAMNVRTSLSSMSSLRSLAEAEAEKKKSMERVSTGVRINRAADDAAGLGVAENLTAQLNGLLQAGRTANNGISLLQVADGALNEVGSLFGRMRELAVQAGSDLLGASERGSINDEIASLQKEAQRIMETTEFNGRKLFDGSMQSAKFDVGGSQTINVSLNGIDAPDIDVSSATSASNSLSSIDAALQSVQDQRSSVGATQNRFEAALRNVEQYSADLTRASSRIQDTDLAQEAAQLARNAIVSQAAVSILGQANALNQSALRLLA
jgi:flagellin